MNITILLNSLEGGGAERVVLTQCDGFLSSDCNVDLILLYKNNSYMEPKNINIHYLLEQKPANIFKKIFSIFILVYKLKRTIKLIESKNRNIDLFFSHLPFSNYIAWLANVKNHFAIIHSIYSNKYISSLKRKVISYIHRRKNIVAVSNGIKDDLIKNFNLSGDNIKVIYNPFDIEKIKSSSLEIVNIEKPYIIHVGRFDKIKRHDILIKAYINSNIKSHFDLYLVGNGAEKSNIEQMIKEYNITDKVKLLGWQDNAYKWIKNASLLVLSSDSEGFGAVLVEALICNTPIVSTNSKSGPSEIMIGELSNYLSKVGDYKNLADKIDLAIEYYPDITSNYYSKFSINKVIKRYKDLKNEI